MMPQKMTAGNEKLPAKTGKPPLIRVPDFLSCFPLRPAKHFRRENQNPPFHCSYRRVDPHRRLRLHRLTIKPWRALSPACHA